MKRVETGLELYYSDLSEETQRAIRELYGLADTDYKAIEELDLMPISIIPNPSHTPASDAAGIFLRQMQKEAPPDGLRYRRNESPDEKTKRREALMAAYAAVSKKATAVVSAPNSESDYSSSEE